ncbi:DUF2326 domain-containing protein [Pseudomonas sp. NMI760_13]|uniref:DUF2326 domain-containing protein n=1 Tax=Pseudomonas sp. NMI760_13 TaxID=2903147 RepID=UPI001E48EB09|nr:DUF2326 domain-containing protein [Pseudomonas sp. NMI760_13]MCE0917394.1 DUF2326 domain-containing protein [Pseudomonas sp. NMI760_13]
MLTYIECEWFTDKRITFKEKLNIVVGDRANSNSIGKSTLLKVVDFIYGGDTLITHSKDVHETLGHHSYVFKLTLDKEYVFERNTGTPTQIHLHGENGEIKEWSTSEYLEFLQRQYTPEIEELSFRSVVSLMTRVWGRDNLDVRRPLHNFSAESGSQCIEWLIKVFNRFGPLADLSIRQNKLSNEQKSLNAAAKQSIIPKITKSKYTKNQEDITTHEHRLDTIRSEISSLAMSINELIDEAVLESKTEKNQLLEIKMSLSSELERVRANLEDNKRISKRSFQPLAEIIPSLNLEKLDTIESFHNGLTRILRKEIKEKELELLEQIGAIDAEIAICNAAIAKALKNSGNPTYIVDSVIDISLALSKLTKENELYEKFTALAKEIKDIRDRLKELKVEILESIERNLNIDIQKLVNYIYGEQRASPVLALKPDKYSYEIPKDTGTGKAYSNLILLDTSLLRYTSIPFLIHDSILFKNVENRAIENILYVYRALKQQSFIALDGEIVESESAQTLVESCAVIHLNADKLLYTKDWRRPENKPQPI